MIDFPDPVSNEAAMPQLEELLTRVLVLPLQVRVATGGDDSPLAQQLSVLHRRFPLQFTPVSGRFVLDADTQLVVLPGTGETPSAALTDTLQAVKPVLSFASLAARQLVDAFKEGGRGKAAPHWFYRSDVEALWDATWSCVEQLNLLPKGAGASA